jgi:hypothetical protein
MFLVHPGMFGLHLYVITMHCDTEVVASRGLLNRASAKRGRASPAPSQHSEDGLY